MSEQKKEVAILSVVLVIFVFVLLSMVIRIKARQDRYKIKAKKALAPLITEEPPSPEDLDSIFSKTQIRRDPFILGGPEKLGEEAEDETGLELTAIAWDQQRPLAIINNEVVGVNDEINGAKIVAIEKNKVKLTKDNQTWELKLFPE